MAKETFYFSHDYNARSDEKIKKLLMKYGFLGYGIFWAIIEDLYQNANAMRTDYELLAFEYRTQSDIIKNIINDFNLFVIKGNEFGSLSVQSRLDDRDIKSKKARKSAYARWERQEDNANAMRTQCECNAIKESKVKESKVNKSKENIKPPAFSFLNSLLEIGISKQIASDWIAVRNKKRAANTETAFNAIKKEIDKSNINANDCIKIAVEKSWSGFKADWLKDNSNPSVHIPKFVC
jgi:hypothetical protein